MGKIIHLLKLDIGYVDMMFQSGTKPDFPGFYREAVKSHHLVPTGELYRGIQAKMMLEEDEPGDLSIEKTIKGIAAKYNLSFSFAETRRS